MTNLKNHNYKCRLCGSIVPAIMLGRHLKSKHSRVKVEDYHQERDYYTYIGKRD